MLSLLVASFLSTAAAAPSIHGGELAGSLSDSAHTLPAGDTRLQILLPSSFGITDTIEGSTSILGWLGGPNAAAELGLLPAGGPALSVKPSVAWSWAGDLTAGAEVMYTIGGPTENRFTVAGGASYGTTEGVGLSTTVRAGYDLMRDERRMWQFLVSVDPYSSVQNTAFEGTVGAGHIWAWETYRLQLGVVSASGNDLAVAVSDGTGTEIDIPAVLPLPYMVMWWRF